MFMRACAVTLIIVLSFVVSKPVTESVFWILANFWALYGAYIQLWLEQHHSFVVVLCSLCGAVAALYVTVVPGLIQSTEHNNYEPAKRAAVAAPEKVTNFSANGRMLMSLEEPIGTPPAKDNPAARPHVQGGPPLSLSRQYDHFHKLVNLDCLIPMLFQDEVLEHDVIERIQDKPTRKRQIMCLLNAVQQNGREGIKQLIMSIGKEKEHMGHTELAHTLKEELSDVFKDTPTGDKQEMLRPEDEEMFSIGTIIPLLHLETIMVAKLTLQSVSQDQNVEKCNLNGLKVIPSGNAEGVLHIATGLVGNFQWPPNYELVSAVYAFWSENKIQHDLKFDVQHCVSIGTAKQATCLSFATADISHGPPFNFSLLKGGEFLPNNTRGVIVTKPQGLLAIVKRKLGRLTTRTEPQLLYDARVFYTVDADLEYTAHFVVTPSTLAWQQALKQHFKDAIPGYDHEFPVSFVKDSITVSLPDGGVMVDGWKITCITSKAINRQDVVGPSIDRLSFGVCRLSIKWAGQEGHDTLPSDLHYNVFFTGSHQRKPDNYFHLHVRSNTMLEIGECIKGLFGCSMEDNPPKSHSGPRASDGPILNCV